MKQPRRAQSDRRDQTRAAVIDAAAELIARNGFAAATLEQIAQAAGLSKGAVHHHFRAKHELVEPVLARCVARLQTRAREAQQPHGAPGDRLRAALRALWTAQHERGTDAAALTGLMALGAHDERVRAAVATTLREIERAIADALASALAASGLRARVSLEALPPLLVAMLVGAALEARCVERDADADARAMEAFETLAMSAFAF